SGAELRECTVGAHPGPPTGRRSAGGLPGSSESPRSSRTRVETGGAAQRPRAVDAREVQSVLATRVDVRERIINVLGGQLRRRGNRLLIQRRTQKCLLRRDGSERIFGDPGDANSSPFAEAVRTVFKYRRHAGNREAGGALPHLLIRGAAGAGPSNSD